MLSHRQRVLVWDAAFEAVRAHFRSTGVLEVTTPVRLVAPALEPYIEPLAAPPGFLATSPELPMKRLLCRGSGSIMQIAHCFRGGERGDRHREEFHLVEWYRVDAKPSDVMRDVEAVVAAVFAAAERVLGASPPAMRWCTRRWFELFEETTGIALAGDEDETRLRARAGDLVPLAPPRLSGAPSDVRDLWAWTALFSSWSDAFLDPYLLERSIAGLHVVDFPVQLAALARVEEDGLGRVVARRFESYVGGVEVSNGYFELRDADEQRTRFERVASLRAFEGAGALPLDEGFLRDLFERGLPSCTGCALGLDRLMMIACGQRSLANTTLFLSDAGGDDA